MKKVITKDDLLPMAEYEKIRPDHRRRLVEMKRLRRIDVGPFVTFYFENYETMWSQVMEMLYIEQGGDAQVPGELAAYNPLIPQGRELVATMMIEIENEDRRKEMLAQLGHIEDSVTIAVDGQVVKGVPEDDVDRTTPDGKTSSVHFLHFPFTPEQIELFRQPGRDIILGIGHPNYQHMTIIPPDVRAALAQDFDI